MPRNDDVFLSGLADGVGLALATLLCTAVLECVSLSTVRNIRAKQSGRELYARGWRSQVINHLMFGAPLVAIAAVVTQR